MPLYFTVCHGGSDSVNLRWIGTFLGEVTLSVYASLFKMGLLLKERICSLWSKFFPLRVKPILRGLSQLRKQTGSHESCFPL